MRPSFHEHLVGRFRGKFFFWTGEQLGPSKWKGELTSANSLLPPFGTPTTKILRARILGTPLCRSLDITSWVASLTTSHFRDSEIARPRLLLPALEIIKAVHQGMGYSSEFLTPTSCILRRWELCSHIDCSLRWALYEFRGYVATLIALTLGPTCRPWAYSHIHYSLLWGCRESRWYVAMLIALGFGEFEKARVDSHLG